MRILLSNNHLQKVGGTENYTYALAEELLRRGHEVEYFTFNRGEVSDRFERLGVPFMCHRHYDLILANHTTTVKRLCYKGYMIQTCHGTISALEQPHRLADAHVAVSEKVASHLAEKGFDCRVILNGVNCRRFAPKSPPQGSSLPDRVLSLCQSDNANDFLRRCCELAGVELVQINKHTDNVWAVEENINRADLVVGIGRSLYDAMACGRCVISLDHRDFIGERLGDGYLTAENIGASLHHNCSGLGGSGRTFDEDDFVAELKKYNPADGAWARQFALEYLNIEKAVDAYLDYAASRESLWQLLTRHRFRLWHAAIRRRLNLAMLHFKYSIKFLPDDLRLALSRA